MTLLKRRFFRTAAILGAALIAASCAETQLGAQAVKEVARTDASAKPEPVLAPDTFDASGLTIWDGASTLEGVWVAHPLAQRAQRVRVINQENQIEVEGAMFRRDPTLSGPSILVSSDAARLLGLEPGVPTEMRIIALREGVYAAPSQTATQPAETGAIETTALAAPEAQENEVPPSPEPVDETTNEVIEPSETAEATPTFESSETTTPESAPEEPAPVAAAAPSPEPPASTSNRPKTAITAADLRGDAAPQPAPATPASEPTQQAAVQPKPAPAQPTPAQPAPSPKPAQQAATTQPTVSSGAYQSELPSGQFVQAGAFGVEANAATLVATLRGAGLPAQYVQRDVNGASLNIVMIGPLADDAAADAAVSAAAQAGAPGARKVIR